MNDLLEVTINLAQEAFERGDVPVGAVIASEEGEILAEASNKGNTDNNPAAHAEILCYGIAGSALKEHNNLYLYSSLEPCFGCGFFIRYTNIKTIVWAANDGYKGSTEDLKKLPKLKDDFEGINFIAEPDEELRKKSRELMYKYLSTKGSGKSARHFMD